MVRKLIALALFAPSLADAAHAYDWMANQHACIVENSNYITVDGSTVGNWTNAPKTFFIKIQNCAEYAKAKGLPYVYSEMGDPPLTREQLNVNNCVETKNGQNLSLILVDGLMVGFPQPVWGFTLITFPQASAGGTMNFNDDGFVDFSTYGVLDDKDINAWFTLRAHCTVLDK
jgi:hypothetical protein